VGINAPGRGLPGAGVHPLEAVAYPRPDSLISPWTDRPALLRLARSRGLRLVSSTCWTRISITRVRSNINAPEMKLQFCLLFLPELATNVRSRIRALVLS
jgi:hypothetical protein